MFHHKWCFRGHSTAHSANGVLAVAVSILNQLEAIATLQGDEDYVLPHASTMHVFRALRLGPDEELGVLDYIKRPNRVRLTEIKAWTRQPFKDLSLLRRTLHQARREYRDAETITPPPPPKTAEEYGQSQEDAFGARAFGQHGEETGWQFNAQP